MPKILYFFICVFLMLILVNVCLKINTADYNKSIFNSATEFDEPIIEFEGPDNSVMKFFKKIFTGKDEYSVKLRSKKGEMFRIGTDGKIRIDGKKLN